MHTIVIGKKVDGLLGKMYVAAIAKVMGIGIPSKVKLITENDEKMYNVSSFNIDGIKNEEP